MVAILSKANKNLIKNFEKSQKGSIVRTLRPRLKKPTTNYSKHSCSKKRKEKKNKSSIILKRLERELHPRGKQNNDNRKR